jgi:hypothetical protein
MIAKTPKTQDNPTIDPAIQEIVRGRQKSIAELESLTLRLGHWGDTRARMEALGEKEGDRYRELSRRRDILIREHSRHPLPDTRPGPPAASPHGDAFADRMGKFPPGLVEWLFPWQEIATPFMAEGIATTPGAPLTSGGIGTLGLYLGGCAYGGNLVNGAHSSDVQWWLRNWTCTIPFLPAASNGTLHYRFAVDALCNLYRPSALGGSLMAFVTVGTSNDIVRKPLSGWRDAGWPINRPLPLAGFPSLDGSVLVDGTVRVARGQRAAIGLIVGMVVGVSQGAVPISWGNFGTRRWTFNRTVGPGDYGMIEYRFAADALVNAAEKLHALKLDLGNP